MHTRDIFDDSDALADELLAMIELPLLDDSPKVRTSDVACSLALEHWHSARTLLRAGLLPSALVVHRAQFEALARSIWLAYAASDEHISKLTSTISLESEQAAKNMPQVAEMMQDLAKKPPQQAYKALSRFKDNSWKALNSYAHAGIHPIRRHDEGYPLKLIHDVLRNANGLAGHDLHASCSLVWSATAATDPAGTGGQEIDMHASAGVTPNPSVKRMPGELRFPVPSALRTPVTGYLEP